YKILSKALDVSSWHKEVSRWSSWGKDANIEVKDASGKKKSVSLPKGIRKIISELHSYLYDEKQKGHKQEIIKNIKQIALTKLKTQSNYRSNKTTLFYRTITRLDETHAERELPKILKGLHG